MSTDHWILTVVLGSYGLGSAWILGRIIRDGHKSQESLEAIMHGQVHIAELVAEVLRRTPPR